MRQNSWNYPASKMRQLLYGSDTLSTGSFAGAAAATAAAGDDVASQFIAKGLRLDFQTLIDNNIIPADFTEKMVIEDDYPLPQTTDFSSFPTDRSDVFFLGAPRSGKSTVLSGLFYTMNREGRWRHQICRDKNTGTDSSINYYNGLLKAVAEHKSPVSTQTDTISYISMDVPVGRDADANPGRNKDMARLNFVELSGEAVKSLANSLSPGVSGTGVWQNLGASQIMQNNNKKVLFFLLDYNVILGHQSGYSDFDQERTLSTALQVLTHDGKGKDFTKGCTMSKVESVAVILTKADLMGTTDRNERREIAFSYLKENFKAFMNSLTDCCHRYNINSAMSHLPYIFTFSVGKFYVGNTMEFDSTDSLELAKIIQDLAPYSKTGIFG